MARTSAVLALALWGAAIVGTARAEVRPRLS